MPDTSDEFSKNFRYPGLRRACVFSMVAWAVAGGILFYFLQMWRPADPFRTHLSKSSVLLSVLPQLLLPFGWMARALLPKRSDEKVRPTVVGMVVGFVACLLFFGATLVPAIRYCPVANETIAESAFMSYAEAQEAYRRQGLAGNGVGKYARDLNTLAETGLLDRTFAAAEMGAANEAPRAGYLFKVLTAQGPHAVGGRKSYLDAKGDLTLGHAIVACPAQYNQTGQDSLIMANDGTIFKADLGPDTRTIVSSMTEFDPDPKWVPTR